MAQAGDIIVYDYKALYLTKEETRNGANFGLKFALKNKDRWEPILDSTYELQTYDKGFSQIVHDNKLYMIQRDFIFVDEHTRLFICKFYDAEVDRYEPDEVEEPAKPVINVYGKYDKKPVITTEETDEVEESDETAGVSESVEEVSEEEPGESDTSDSEENDKEESKEDEPI